MKMNDSGIGLSILSGELIGGMRQDLLHPKFNVEDAPEVDEQLVLEEKDTLLWAVTAMRRCCELSNSIVPLQAVGVFCDDVKNDVRRMNGSIAHDIRVLRDVAKTFGCSLSRLGQADSPDEYAEKYGEKDMVLMSTLMIITALITARLTILIFGKDAGNKIYEAVFTEMGAPPIKVLELTNTTINFLADENILNAILNSDGGSQDDTQRPE